MYRDSEDYNRLSCFLAIEYIATQKYDEAIEMLISIIKSSKKYKNLAELYLMQVYLMAQSFDLLKSHIQNSFFDFIKFENEANSLIIEQLEKLNFSFDLLDKIFLSITEFYLSINENQLAKKWCDIAILVNPKYAHCYINRAFFEEKGTNNFNAFIYKAISLNHYITNPIIYENGYKPNIYIHQTAFLSIVELNLSDFEK